MADPKPPAKPTDLLWTFAAIMLLILVACMALDIPTKGRWDMIAFSGVAALVIHARTVKWLMTGK